MRVGISVITQEGQSIWSNGLAQNVFVLAQLFRSLPFVSQVVLLNCGDQPAFAADAGPTATAFPLVPPKEASDLVDVIIEMGGGLDLEWLDLMRARGKKVVYHICGHPYVNLTEHSVFGTDGYFVRPDRCDELWVLDEYAAFLSLLSRLHRCPAHAVPHIWTSDFIVKRTRDVLDAGLAFGLQPGMTAWPRGGMRTAMFEPNIAVVKTSVIPMLICDVAARREPDAVAAMTVLNSVQLSENLTFSYLANSLDLVKSGRAWFEHRHDFAGFMAQHGDAVVSHQWRNETNYLYYDALWGGYPLIHNSAWTREVGYYYPDFEVAEGAAQLLNAYHNHLPNLEPYRRRAHSFLARLDPLTAGNRDLYARRLLRLMGEGA